jgi:hypothetical protein
LPPENGRDVQAGRFQLDDRAAVVEGGRGLIGTEEAILKGIFRNVLHMAYVQHQYGMESE